ncbi:MAG: hypothetical protein AB2A00_08570 [Myxococcota bacterium]
MKRTGPHDGPQVAPARTARTLAEWRDHGHDAAVDDLLGGGEPDLDWRGRYPEHAAALDEENADAAETAWREGYELGLQALSRSGRVRAR